VPEANPNTLENTEKFGALSGFGVDRLAVPGCGFECEIDAGVGGAGVTLVDAERQAQGGRFEGDDGLFRLADGGAQDALAVFEVAAGQSAWVP
jgi:hypothetical protein